MRKEYDLRSLKVKRRGVVADVKEPTSQKPARKAAKASGSATRARRGDR